MIIQSLGHRTDLIFAKFWGRVIEKGSYTLIQTPSNPNYYWGNYIIFNSPPQKGSLQEWKGIFDREFGYYSKPHHYAFTWDIDQSNNGNSQEFLDAQFELDSNAVLSTSMLKAPPYANNHVEIRKVTADKDWDKVTKLQILCADPKFKNDDFKQFKLFKQKQMAGYRQMSEAGLGFWFGAFDNDDKLVADLGIFYEGKVGRYQNVETHPDHRRQGICGTLVYQSGLLAFEKFAVEHLVMVADTNYHAVKIYESVGFKRSEVNHTLCWWNNC